MTKGTPSKGKHQKITHIRCRRCGHHSYHIRKSECAACGYPNSKTYKFKWRTKTLQGKRRFIKPGHQKPKTTIRH